MLIESATPSVHTTSLSEYLVFSYPIFAIILALQLVLSGLELLGGGADSHREFNPVF